MLFEFLYDDEAPGPFTQVKDAVGAAASNARAKLDKSLATKTGKAVSRAAAGGLVVGAAIGVTVLVVGTALGIVHTVFGSRD